MRWLWRFKKAILLFLSCGFIFFSVPVIAGPPVVLDPQQAKYDLAPNMDMYISRNRNLTVEQVSSRDFNSNFVPYNVQVQTSAKNYNSTVWLRFVVTNPTSEAYPIFLTRDYVNQYQQWQVYIEGPNKKFTKLAIPKKTLQNDTFPISIPAHTTQQIYMTNYSEGWLQTTFMLQKPYEALLRECGKYFIMGIQYGIIIALFFNTFFIYLFLRDRSYAIYLLFVTVCFIAAVLLDGGLNALPHVEVSNWFYLHIFRFNTVLFGFLYALFAKEVLQLKQYAPRINQFFNLYLFCAFPLAIFVFMPYFGHYQLAYLSPALPTYYGVIGLGTAFIASMIVMRAGYRPARYYFAGIASLTVCLVIYALRLFNVVPYSVLISRIPGLGVNLDMILQAIALAVRFELIQQSEIQAQQRIIKQTTRISKLQQSALKGKQQLIQAYSRFFPKRFLELLDKKNVLQIKLGDHAEHKMTVLFADLRNFTTILEKKSAEESFYFINNYLNQIGPLVRQNNGFIDKYIGDAILALFSQRSEDAIKTAIQIVTILKSVEKDVEAMGGQQPTIEMGIGIHYGELMVGTIGEEERMDGTVISDTVNVSSRMENLNKIYGTSILISQQVLDNLTYKEIFYIRYVDRILLKGKFSDITLFEIFNNDPPEIREKKLSIQTEFDTAIQYYQQQQFDQALPILARCQAVLPTDVLISLYIERCQLGQTRGYDQSWQPVARFTEKIEMSR